MSHYPNFSFILIAVFFSTHLGGDYMYDDSIGSSNYSNVHRHWYDEPPYESDPDDFLMAGMGAAAKIQVSHS
jgi:hypothetical protein